MPNKIIPYNPWLKKYARKLRNNSTKSEIALWQKIKGKSFGVQFHRQVPILDFIVDFYCHELLLAIEIDGYSHNFKFEEDQNRELKLQEHGIFILRFQDKEVLKDMNNVIREIEYHIENQLNAL